jgi:hypothetical protein
VIRRAVAENLLDEVGSAAVREALARAGGGWGVLEGLPADWRPRGLTKAAVLTM